MLVLFYLSFSFQNFSHYAFGFFVLLIRKSVCVDNVNVVDSVSW